MNKSSYDSISKLGTKNSEPGTKNSDYKKLEAKFCMLMIFFYFCISFT
ncbi:MAG: hypothetical protein MI674_05685 [Cytophagales bacterium]|nr:hypothetical protein [Cytophagales bacterium]